MSSGRPEGRGGAQAGGGPHGPLLWYSGRLQGVGVPPPRGQCGDSRALPGPTPLLCDLSTWLPFSENRLLSVT